MNGPLKVARRLLTPLSRRFLKVYKDLAKSEPLLPNQNPNSASASTEPIPAITNLRKELAFRKPFPPKTDNKLTVFLEPEGVLFASFTPHPFESYYNKPLRPYEYDFEIPVDGEASHALMYMRPHWRLLTQFLRDHCETYFYSTCEGYYLDKVIEAVGSQEFDFVKGILTQEDCGVIRSEFDGVEELSKVISGLGRPLERAILIDHNPLCLLSEPENAVPVMEYSPSEDRYMTDAKLLELIEVLKALVDLPDVRPTLQTRYGMSEMVSELNYT
jgi:hypothetical protein